jgi:DNA primase
MKIEGIDFKDALRLLADRAGVSLQNFKKDEASNLIDIVESATLFYEHTFSQSSEAKKYLESRGVSNEMIQKFRIGFAPNDWRQLYGKLNKAGYSDEEIVTSGLCIKHERGLYDRFRNRVMFPIMNASGKVVAFSGRIMPTAPVENSATPGTVGNQPGHEPAKYVNSPETPMYHKSSILFGYNFAKQEIAKQKKVLVVEGQMDVVMAHQAGNTNTVAISGTAFTPEHISILKRFAETVVLALDTDKAGYTAMLKSAALALENDLEVEGIKLDEKDPADMIKTHIDSWHAAVASSKPILLLIAEIIIEKEKIKPRQIQLLRRDLFPLLRVVKSPLLKESYTQEIGKMLGIDISIIKQETENVKTEIELQIKKEKKKVPQIEILTFLAETVATLNMLANQNLKSFYFEKLNKYLNMQDEYKIEQIPEVILNKEHMVLEKRLNEESKNPEEQIKILEKFAKEICTIFIKKIIEKRLDEKKGKIKEGVDLEENLKEVQFLTKEIMSLSSLLTTDPRGSVVEK